MKNLIYITNIAFALSILFCSPVFSQSLGGGLPALNIIEQANGDTTYSLSLQILALMTGLTLLPSLVLGMTSFTRIIIVLSILRQAMGTQQTPPNQVLIAIALFLSFFIMSPTLTKIYDDSITPFLAEEMTAENALESGSIQIKEFMVKNTRKNDLSMFTDMSGEGNYLGPGDVPFSVILPAFITSELKSLELAFCPNSTSKTRVKTNKSAFEWSTFYKYQFSETIFSALIFSSDTREY